MGVESPAGKKQVSHRILFVHGADICFIAWVYQEDGFGVQVGYRDSTTAEGRLSIRGVKHMNWKEHKKELPFGNLIKAGRQFINLLTPCFY
jgi:hypothetical protein